MKELKDYSGKKVLYIDDDTTNLMAGVAALKRFNLEVHRGNTMAHLFEQIRANEYDLIILDDMMPEMRFTGTDAMKKLKAEGFSKPIIVLTGNVASYHRKSYLEDGFNEYLSKPINIEELARILHIFLDN